MIRILLKSLCFGGRGVFGGGERDEVYCLLASPTEALLGVATELHICIIPYML